MKNRMKLVVLLFTGIFCNAQFLIDDSEIIVENEAGRSQIAFDLSRPVEFYRLKCASPVYAKPNESELAFKEKLGKGMKAYLDHNSYSVNGTFDLNLEIGSDGILKSVAVRPEVPNSDMLQRDLAFIIRQISPQWDPATCNGSQTDSRIRMRINFRTENFDL